MLRWLRENYRTNSLFLNTLSSFFLEGEGQDEGVIFIPLIEYLSSGVHGGG
jgi:hypothetical protein